MFANYVDSMFIHCFYDPWNLVSKYFQNALIEFVQTLPPTEATKVSTSSLKRFLKKKKNKAKQTKKNLIETRNAKARKRNGAILLPR